MKIPYLWPREGGIFYFRRKVPKDLLSRYASSPIQYSLHTRDPSEAKRLVILESAKHEKDFARLRANAALEPRPISAVPPLYEIKHITDELIKSLHNRWIHADLLTDDQNRETGFEFDDLGGVEREEQLAEMKEASGALKKILGSGKLDQAEDALHSYLWACGLNVSRDAPNYRKLLKSHIEALVRSVDAKFRRADGEVIRAEDLAPYPPALPWEQEALPDTLPPEDHSASSVVLLSKVIQDFLDDEAKRGVHAMMKKHRAVMPMLLEFITDKPIASVKQADIKGFFALVHKLPPRWSDIRNKKKLSLFQIADMPHEKLIAEATFSGTYRASVSVFLDWAVSNYQDQGFPTTLTLNKVEYRGTRMKGVNKQRAFTMDELRNLYQGSKMAQIAADPDQQNRYWLCHIGLFTGARINEICQINPQTDIRFEAETGIWYFWITTETEAAEGVERSIKTKKPRQVPIHRTLIDLGMLDYVEKIKSSRSKAIFPRWKPYEGRASPNAGKWFIRHLKKIGIHGMENANGNAIHGSHAFRHTVLSYGKRPPLKLNLRCITGHAEKDEVDDKQYSDNKVAEGYEDETITTPLSEKKQLLDQLDYGIAFIKPVLP